MISWLKSKLKIKYLDDRIIQLEQQNAKHERIILEMTQELEKKDKQVNFLYAFSKKLEKRNEELYTEVHSIQQTIEEIRRGSKISHEATTNTPESNVLEENLEKHNVGKNTNEKELSLLLVENSTTEYSYEIEENVITIDCELELQDVVEKIALSSQVESEVDKISENIVLTNELSLDYEDSSIEDVAPDDLSNFIQESDQVHSTLKTDAELLPNLNFVALDVETANRDRSSICSLGLVEVKCGKIVRSEQFLIRPKKLEFEPMNVMIHGIKASDVKDQLRFDELWPVIKEFIGEKMIIAHNASFDMSAMKKVLQLYNITYPEFKYVCTQKLSKKILPELTDYKLSTIATHFDLELNHHEAISDAKVCAEIALIYCKKTATNNIESLLKSCGVEAQYLEVDDDIKRTPVQKTSLKDENSPVNVKSDKKDMVGNDMVFPTSTEEQATSFIGANNWEEWSIYVHEELAQVKSQSKAHKTKCIELDHLEKTAVFSGRNDKLYEVTLSTCECFDFMRKQKPCKHMYSLANRTGTISLFQPNGEESDLIIMRSIHLSEDFVPDWGGWDKRIHSIPSQKKRRQQGKKEQHYLEHTQLDHCSCKDYKHRKFPCKHIYALKFYTD